MFSHSGVDGSWTELTTRLGRISSKLHSIAYLCASWRLGGLVVEVDEPIGRRAGSVWPPGETRVRRCGHRRARK